MEYAIDVLNILIAVLPPIIVMTYVYRMDIIEKEPIKMLLTLFFLGMLITIPVSMIENLITDSIKIDGKDYIAILLFALLGIALIEEGFKYLVVYLRTWKDKNFNHIYDGIVYAVFASLGFALVENVHYVISNGDNGTYVAVFRAIISVPAHAFFAIASGYYLGLAKLNESIGDKKKKKISLVLSIVIPILLHGLYDFLLLTNNDSLTMILFTFVAILYFVSYYNIKKISSVQMTSNIQDKGGN